MRPIAPGKSNVADPIKPSAVPDILEETMLILTRTKMELDQCLEKKPFNKAVESAFFCLKQSWVSICQLLRQSDFQSEAEEIHFFKKIAPGLTAELEYYELLYHSLLFCPPDTDRQYRFWCRELNRLKDFKHMNQDFYTYYSSGDTFKDQYYFTTKYNELSEPDRKTKTIYSCLVAKLWALEHYMAYVRQKLTECHAG